MLRGLSQISFLSLPGEFMFHENHVMPKASIDFTIEFIFITLKNSRMDISLYAYHIRNCFRYDAHVLDPLASLQFTTGTYYMLASNIQQLAKDLCGGRCVFFLEGGYNLESLSYSVADSFRAFLGEPSLASEFDNPAFLHEEPSTRVRQAIQRVKQIHSL